MRRAHGHTAAPIENPTSRRKSTAKPINLEIRQSKSSTNFFPYVGHDDVGSRWALEVGTRLRLAGCLNLVWAAGVWRNTPSLDIDIGGTMSKVRVGGDIRNVGMTQWWWWFERGVMFAYGSVAVPDLWGATSRGAERFIYRGADGAERLGIPSPSLVLRRRAPSEADSSYRRQTDGKLDCHLNTNACRIKAPFSGWSDALHRAEEPIRGRFKPLGQIDGKA